MEKLKKYFSNIKKWYDQLNTNERLYVSFICVIIIAVIYFILNRRLVEKNKVINYKKDINNNYLIFSTTVDNYDDYAIVKSIADSFLVSARDNKLEKLNKEQLKNIYKYLLYSEYKSSISQSKLSSKMNTFYDKIISYYGTIDNAIPISISVYSTNFYVVTYGNDQVDSSRANLGIVLNKELNEYYIWYID